MDPETIRFVYEVIGIGTAICAAFGVLATFATAVKFLRGKDNEDEELGFRKYFTLFSSLSFLYNAGLIGVGVLLINARPVLWWLFLLYLLLPWLYVGCLGRLWRNPTYGLAMGAATGVGNVGMVVPSFLLLPLWSPLALWVIG